LPFELHHQFPAQTREVRVARDLLRRWLIHARVPQDEAYDVLLAFSELAANAITAGQLTPTHEATVIDLTARRLGGEAVVLEVSGPGAPIDPRLMAGKLPSDLAEDGRGLAIVNLVADTVETERVGPTTMIRATKSVTAQPLYAYHGNPVQ
jgi:anti-sigma regulatory factor (Ser/Thr protein kinase)